MRIFDGLLSHVTIMGELLEFFWQRKSWWLTPLVLALLIVGVFIVFAQSSAIAPIVPTTRSKRSSENLGSSNATSHPAECSATHRLAWATCSCLLKCPVVGHGRVTRRRPRPLRTQRMRDHAPVAPQPPR